MTSTQQSEALQAVRLLYDAALSGVQQPRTSANIETLYQARVLLEGFIKSAGVLESTGNNQPKESIEIIFENALFREGEFIYTMGPKGLRPEKIEKLDPETNWIEYSRNGFHHLCPLSDIIELNPGGSK